MQLSNPVLKFVHRLLNGLGEVTDGGIGWAGRAWTPNRPTANPPSCPVVGSQWLSRAAKPLQRRQDRL